MGYWLQKCNYFSFAISKGYCACQYFLDLEPDFQVFKIVSVFMMLNAVITQN